MIRFFIQKKLKAIILLALISLATGCVHSPLPYLEKNWQHRRLPLQNLTDTPDKACLQILIMYSGHSCAHSALRIYSPDKGALFWDPGGGYGSAGSVSARRQRDLVFDKTPSLNDYLAFRKEIPTSATEIFEWKLSLKKGAELYDILLTASGKPFTPNSFSTDADGLFCGYLISIFLYQFTKDIVNVDKTFFPHNLAKQFYKQHPDRVIIVKDDNILEYRPPPVNN